MTSENEKSDEILDLELDGTTSELESCALKFDGARRAEMAMFFARGDELAKAKAANKGTWGAWLVGRCMNPTAARRSMSASIAIPDVADREVVADRMDRGALFELTAPKAPPEALAAALRAARHGEHITVRWVREFMQQHAKEARAAGVVHLPDSARIEHCDFHTFAIAPGSVDLLLTDPPYDEASVPLYGDVARLAAECLRPNGWCLAYGGKMFEARIHYRMKQHLKWGWSCDVIHAKPTLIKSLQILQNAKRIFGYRREPGDAWWDVLNDRLEFPAEKGFHSWQQPVAEAEYLIQTLCPEGGVVFDPMCGTGTVAVAALRLGRTFVGCDRDPDMIEIARQRIAETVSEIVR